MVSYPSLGLNVHYSRLTYADPLAVYQSDVKADPSNVELDYIAGVPALVIPGYVSPQIARTSFVQFVIGGTTVGLVADLDVATLERLAKSIVDQANAS